MLINTWWYKLLSLLVGFKAKVATKFDIQYIFFITNNFPYCNKNSTGTTSNNLKGIHIDPNKEICPCFSEKLLIS